MKALLTKILGDLRGRRVQAIVIFVIVALTAGVGTLGIEILNGASAPFDNAFEQNAGAHIRAYTGTLSQHAGESRRTGADYPPARCHCERRTLAFQHPALRLWSR